MLVSFVELFPWRELQRSPDAGRIGEGLFCLKVEKLFSSCVGESPTDWTLDGDACWTDVVDGDSSSVRGTQMSKGTEGCKAPDDDGFVKAFGWFKEETLDAKRNKQT